MKKIICILLSLVLMAFAVTSCDKPKSSDSSGDNNNADGGGDKVETPDNFKEEFLDINYDDPIVYSDSFYKVTDFGAKGDGSANDAPSVKKAIDEAAKESVDNTVYFPKGSYKMASGITFPLTMTFIFEEGAVLDIEKNTEVNFNGTIHAFKWQVFGGEGDITGFLNNRYVFPQWFGAKGDGETDDSYAFSRAINHANEIAIPSTEKGYVIKEITVPAMKRIYGCDEQKSLIVGHSECENAFVFLDSSKEIIIYNLAFDMSKTDKSTCFFFNSTNTASSFIELRSIDTNLAYHVIRDAHIPPNKLFITNIVIDRFICTNSRSIAIYTKNFWGFIFFRNLIFDNAKIEEEGKIAGNYPAVDVGENAGAILQNIKIIGSNNPANTKEDGFYYDNNVATWMDSCTVENVGGMGINVFKGSHLYFSKITLNNMFSHGFFADTSFYTQADDIQIVGNPNSSGNSMGVYLKGGGADGQFNRMKVKGMTGNGVLIEKNKYTAFTSLISEDNRLAGYFDMGDNNACVSAALKNNKGENQLVQEGKNSVATNVTVGDNAIENTLGKIKQ